MTTPTFSHARSFNTVSEAILAFYRKELEWIDGDKAYAHRFRPRSSNVIGHMAVTVIGVHSIDAAGLPVFACRRPDGSFVQIESDMLMTKQELMFKEDGSRSPYHEWFLREQEVNRRRRSRPSNGPPMITGILVF